MRSLQKRSRGKKIVAVLAVLLTFLLVAAISLLTPYPAEPEYLQQVYASEEVAVSEQAGWYELVPAGVDANAVEEAIIFYPGGLVSADAYLYMLSEIAVETGQPIYVVKFPLSLAVTNISAADAVIANYPDVGNWTISGHSLGGSMACRYAKNNPDTIDNLVLMASYCDQSIANTDLSVLTLYGSKNNGINAETLAEFEQNLPQGAKTVLIEGMNHAQFGHYGPQRGDNVATIDDNEATTIVVTEFSSFLR